MVPLALCGDSLRGTGFADSLDRFGATGEGGDEAALELEVADRGRGVSETALELRVQLGQAMEGHRLEV